MAGRGRRKQIYPTGDMSDGKKNQGGSGNFMRTQAIVTNSASGFFLRAAWIAKTQFNDYTLHTIARTRQITVDTGRST